MAELATFAPTRVSHLQGGKVRTYEVNAQDLGLPSADPRDMSVDSAAESAAMIRQVLRGEKGPARDMVCLNAAAALVVADLAEDLCDGLRLAEQAIDSGAAQAVIDKLVGLTNPR